MVLNNPVITQSLEDCFKNESPSSSKKGWPSSGLKEVKPDYVTTKLKPVLELLTKTAADLKVMPTQLCGCLIQNMNYVHNRASGEIGKAIHEDRIGAVTEKKTMPMDEALCLKEFEVEGGSRRLTNIRLRFMK